MKDITGKIRKCGLHSRSLRANLLDQPRDILISLGWDCLRMDVIGFVELRWINVGACFRFVGLS